MRRLSSFSFFGERPYWLSIPSQPSSTSSPLRCPPLACGADVESEIWPAFLSAAATSTARCLGTSTTQSVAKPPCEKDWSVNGSPPVSISTYILSSDLRPRLVRAFAVTNSLVAASSFSSNRFSSLSHGASE
ncbi:putative HTH-type DNA-binding domain-containing acetyltransferase YbfA [Fusarium oxysporum f. sp. albedinis]|nr:putative HTH-type DNA-binding domain-containing acetyltransferase YbfA [Fusarium oxysporum f. sp. albedinis]